MNHLNSDNENANMNANMDQIPTNAVIDSVYDILASLGKVKEVNSDYDTNGVENTNVMITSENSSDGGATSWGKTKCRQCKQQSEKL